MLIRAARVLVVLATLASPVVWAQSDPEVAGGDSQTEDESRGPEGEPAGDEGFATDDQGEAENAAHDESPGQEGESAGDEGFATDDPGEAENTLHDEVDSSELTYDPGETANGSDQVVPDGSGDRALDPAPGGANSNPPAAEAAGSPASNGAACADDKPSHRKTAFNDYFGDIELTDQDGRKHCVYRDLMHNKVVVINAFFTSCQGDCSELSANMASIQDYLGEKLGKEVVMLSITVDPGADTPEVLHQYAALWNARPGWFFLAGPPDNVSFALKKLGLYVENKEAHATIVIVGNIRTGLWRKANGLAPMQELVAIVDGVVNDKGN